MPYNFARRDDIDSVIRLIRGMSAHDSPLGVGNPQHVGPLVLPDLTDGFIYFTPSGGIPARSGSTPGSAECTPYYIDTDGPTLKEILDNGGSPKTDTIYHIGASAVAGDVYILVKRVYGVLIADMEDCG